MAIEPKAKPDCATQESQDAQTALLVMMDKKITLIMLALRQIGTSTRSITPELEAEINEALELSEEIDEKVPDQPQ